MVVRLRLARFGRKKRPFYRIRAANARSPRNGKYLEELGTYDPIPSGVDNMREVRLNVERIKYWLAVGAQPSERVETLLAQAGIIPPPIAKVSVQSAVPKSQREKKKVRVCIRSSSLVFSEKDGFLPSFVSSDISDLLRFLLPQGKRKFSTLVFCPTKNITSVDTTTMVNDHAKHPLTFERVLQQQSNWLENVLRSTE